MLNSLIDGILAASEARRKVAATSNISAASNFGSDDTTTIPTTPKAAGLEAFQVRDLPKSASQARSKGLIPVIAEIKPRILSRPLKDGEAASYATNYERYGACGISVLTEPSYFLGSLTSLPKARAAVDIPVLRKDFIVDVSQITEERADLILLIATILPNLEEMIECVRSHGMQPLVEVHTKEELDFVLKTDADIIGINNRNLRTLEVDLSTFERLGPIAHDSGAFVIAESGVHSHEDALRMVDHGADALLIGSALMKDPKILCSINGFRP